MAGIAPAILGGLDDDGFLFIIGRKKDLIITAGGKNVSPGPMEEVIKRCPFVSQALVLGDKRPFISALITLDEDSLRPWLAKQGLDSGMTMEDAAQNAAVRAEVQKWVDQANEGVSRAESVRKFIILPEEFTQENGLMTASMKIIRPKVLQALQHAAQHADVHQAQARFRGFSTRLIPLHPLIWEGSRHMSYDGSLPYQWIRSPNLSSFLGSDCQFFATLTWRSRFALRPTRRLTGVRNRFLMRTRCSACLPMMIGFCESRST